MKDTQARKEIAELHEKLNRLVVHTMGYNVSWSRCPGVFSSLMDWCANGERLDTKPLYLLKRKIDSLQSDLSLIQEHLKIEIQTQEARKIVVPSSDCKPKKGEKTCSDPKEK